MRDRLGREKKIYKTAIPLLLAVMVSVLCGAGFFETKVALDTKNHVVYQHADAGTVIEAIKETSGKSGNIRTGRYYAVSGIIDAKNENNKKLTIKAFTAADGALSCSASGEKAIDAVRTLGAGDKVTVYGRLNADLLNRISLEIDRIEKTDTEAVNGSLYSMMNGLALDIRDMPERALADGRIKYRIPGSWETVEHDLAAEELGLMEGYQYKLNEIGRKSEYAESFFVCYFDITSFVAENDRGNKKLIEEAILRDILKTDELDRFPVRRETTYYGAGYKYYQDTYRKLSGDKYQAEFVFQELDDDGILVYLYVYNTQHTKDSARDEIMLTMRLTET
ncbi:MAG: hypothetical protein J5966_10450 [Lachnospiraceae bacterium]|nr:hypothetical protein [Lachnospiraceae bacterium]